VERSTWTDERLDEKMLGIDRTFELLRDELSGFRTEMREEMRGLRDDLTGEMRQMRGEMRDEMRELRGDFSGLRSDFAALQRQLIQIGFGMVGVLLAAICALIVAAI